MVDKDTLGLLGQMKQDVEGFTCRPCLLSGVPQNYRRDGSRLGRQDICEGCQEVVCDRHTPITGETRHAARSHGPPISQSGV